MPKLSRQSKQPADRSSSGSLSVLNNGPPRNCRAFPFAISRHLRVLREAGLVSVEPSGRERDPERVLAYAWGLSVVQWTLEPDGDGCRYTFLHYGMAKRDIPDEKGVAAGWHVWLDDLECDLSGISQSAQEKEASFRAISKPYRDRLQIVLAAE